MTYDHDESDIRLRLEWIDREANDILDSEERRKTGGMFRFDQIMAERRRLLKELHNRERLES